MEHTYEELHKMTVAKLRDMAEGLDFAALHGFRTMHKEELLPLLCETLGIEAHEHHEVVGINKSRIKRQIRELKDQRDAALASGDSKELKAVRRKIRRLKHELRSHTV